MAEGSSIQKETGLRSEKEFRESGCGNLQSDLGDLRGAIFPQQIDQIILVKTKFDRCFL